MKVKALLAILATANPDAEVILQKDFDGYSFGLLGSVGTDAVFDSERGAVFWLPYSAEDADMTPQTWEDVLQRPCVVLSPIN